MIDIKHLEIWLVVGSQHLYGPRALKQVQAHAAEVAAALNASGVVPVKTTLQPLVTGPDEASSVCQAANNSQRCIGLITWCHTFSPSKMWINGLKQLRRPLLHLHTQHNRDLPWEEIDMDFMNLNQAAHGDREHGFIMTRMGVERKVVAGHWGEKRAQERIATWARAAAAWHDWQGAKICRIGDNMREVAVTDGDKVEAQIKFGFCVNGYGVGDLVEFVHSATEKEVRALVAEYEKLYSVPAKLKKSGGARSSLREAARIELGLRSFLADKKAKGFTDTFEDLHGLAQLPGIAVQRLMAEGFGFGAEGDWKTAALVRAMKVMAAGIKGGTSFMEDYTYHLHPSGAKVLGAHMLEICPSIARGKPSLEIHPLGIGGKADPVRLVFDTPPGPALNASLIDMGSRFRLLVNEVDVVAPDKPLGKLPVARAVWKCRPDFATAVEAWIYAGGAHHTGFSQAVTTEMLEDFAVMAGVEILVIDNETRLRDFRREARGNAVYHSHKL